MAISCLKQETKHPPTPRNSTVNHLIPHHHMTTMMNHRNWTQTSWYKHSTLYQHGQVAPYYHHGQITQHSPISRSSTENHRTPHHYTAMTTNHHPQTQKKQYKHNTTHQHDRTAPYHPTTHCRWPLDRLPPQLRPTPPPALHIPSFVVRSALPPLIALDTLAAMMPVWRHGPPGNQAWARRLNGGFIPGVLTRFSMVGRRFPR